MLLDTHLIPKAMATKSKVSYLKMKGDYYRYLAEVTNGDERQKIVEESQCAYIDAFNIAKNEIPPAHPIRLGVALNFAVFQYKILKKPDAAAHMAHQLWTSDESGPDNENQLEQQ
ncbi:unnamed protein product [Adineta steineri]|uniref:14-3-3 domain-containing protein n=1 Tax=Adineta steineri TaxID=433720 RepID=A0A818RZF1_9BILA|nr:unnamed protein product [Adineta steineri]CAF1207920.1 unnamed protein product [Adineta steineri]CAF3661089.1 unnamed protein product [Adineta steineri]CAF3924877.1 unnamed protein product [Adineta steineri]